MWLFLMRTHRRGHSVIGNSSGFSCRFSRILKPGVVLRVSSTLQFALPPARWNWLARWRLRKGAGENSGLLVRIRARSGLGRYVGLCEKSPSVQWITVLWRISRLAAPPEVGRCVGRSSDPARTSVSLARSVPRLDDPRYAGLGSYVSRSYVFSRAGGQCQTILKGH